MRVQHESCLFKFQVVTQPQSLSGQPKIIVSSQSPQLQQQTQGSQHQQQQQTVRMLTAQMAGKPIILSSSPTGKTVTGNVVLGKQTVGTAAQPGQQQQIVLPGHQLLNIKTLHGLKVISTPAGLKTTGAAVYARVLAQTTVAQGQNQTSVVTVPATQQSALQPSTVQQQSQQIQQLPQQSARNSPFGGGAQ